MKKILKKALVAGMAMSMVVLQTLPAFASQATSYTYTTDDKKELVRTQDAYLPDRTITNLELSSPSDIIIDEENRMYIADTGNKRVLIYNLDTEVVEYELKHDKFSTPKGLYLDEDGSLYVADTSAADPLALVDEAASEGEEEVYEDEEMSEDEAIDDSGESVDDTAATEDGTEGEETQETEKATTGLVFKFDKDFNLVRTYGKPTAPIFADSNFDPSKITVDASGNLYIICASNNSGVVQLSETGEFLGYFTSNKTVLSAQQRFLKLIYTEEQEKKSELLNTTPTVFSNICIDEKGIIYTTCMNGTNEMRMDLIKKHKTNGGNMFSEGIYSEPHVTDITVNKQGIIFACDIGGYIQIYTSQGELIFTFGASSTFSGAEGKYDIAGLSQELITIAVDRDGNIWTADSDKGFIQSFEPTDYATKIYAALADYESGEYETSLSGWKQVLRLNQMSVLAHNGIGKAYYHEESYAQAMEHFKIAGNREDYSEAFWEVRSQNIADYLPIAFGVIIALIVLRIAWAIGDRHKALTKKKRAISKKLKNTPIIGELGYAFKTARHPIDRYYDIRVGKNGSVIAATIMYIIFFITYMFYQTSKGFIYQYTDIEDMDIGAVVIGFFAILILFIICNYLVTSINDGDGTLKQVYMIPAYGLVPAWISLIGVIGFSYLLTYNESFLLTVALIVGIGWTLVNVFQGLSTVHDYEVGETIVSIIITLVFMLIAAIVVVIVIIMWNQLSDFLFTLGKELIRNVTNP